MLYIADLPRDLGVAKFFSGAPSRNTDFDTNDSADDFEGYTPWLSKGVSSLKAWERTASIDGDALEDLPMYAFASSAGEAISSSRT